MGQDCQDLQARRERLTAEVERKQILLANYDQQRAKVNVKEYRQLEETYQAKQTAYTTAAEKEANLELELLSASKEEEDLSDALLNVSMEVSFRKQHQTTTPKHYRESLQKRREESYQQLEEARAAIDKLREELGPVAEKNHKQTVQIGMLG